MSEDEEKIKAAWEARKKWQAETEKQLEDDLVARFRRYNALAFRMIAGEPEQGVGVSYDPAEVRHLAEMLLLLDIATHPDSFSRFRSRYTGNF